jgi:hypothetical protein
MATVDTNFNQKSQIQANQIMGSTSFIGGGANYITTTTNNQIINNNYGTNADSPYLGTNVAKIANIVTQTTATITGATWIHPVSGSALPDTSIDNFIFFANGINIPKQNIVSFQEVGGNSVLTINPSSLGYYLTNDDSSSKEIIITGKFA